MFSLLKAELLFGFLLCFGLSLVAIRWVGPRGWMDLPSARKLHHAPTPLTGGLVLWTALTIGQLAGWIRLPLHPQEWAAVHLMALMGALDDRFHLRARIKATVGLGVALLLGWEAALDLVAQGGAVVHVAGMDIPNHLFVTMPLAVLWFWGIPQAYNLIDGLNGLALGLALLLLGSMGWGMESSAVFLWGAIFASLLLNYPRARHFMGDSGAFLLGTLLAILALKRGLPTNPNLALWAFAYPMIDVTLVVLIRLAQHKPLGQGDHNHLHDWMTLHLAKVPRGRNLATVMILLLALGPMLHLYSFPMARPLSFLGLLLLVVMAVIQFREQLQVQAALPGKPGAKPSGPSARPARIAIEGS